MADGSSVAPSPEEPISWELAERVATRIAARQPWLPPRAGDRTRRGVRRADS